MTNLVDGAKVIDMRSLKFQLNQFQNQTMIEKFNNYKKVFKANQRS